MEKGGTKWKSFKSKNLISAKEFMPLLEDSKLLKIFWNSSDDLMNKRQANKQDIMTHDSPRFIGNSDASFNSHCKA